MDGVFYVFILLNYHLPKRTLVVDELKDLISFTELKNSATDFGFTTSSLNLVVKSL